MTLKECETYDLKTLKGPADYMVAANSTETLERIEACMKAWIKQIEQVSIALNIEIKNLQRIIAILPQKFLIRATKQWWL